MPALWFFICHLGTASGAMCAGRGGGNTKYTLLYEYKCLCGTEWSETEAISPPVDPKALARLARPTECPSCGRSVNAYPLLRHVD
jgi:hypothetical protein